MKKENDKFILDLENRILDYFYDTSIDKKDFNNLLIDGSWGSGKTTLIKEVLKGIDDKKFKKIKIDVWEYELFESDIILLIFVKILRELGIDDENEANLFESILESLKVIGRDYFKNLIEKFFKVSKTAQDKIKKQWKNKNLDNFEKGSNLLKNLEAIEHLIKYMNAFLNKKNKNIILIFDEIDRCSDDNVLKILTAIKLVILNIKYENLFVICCANSNHIQSVGNNTSENYIDKIFSSSVSLKSNFKYDEELIEHKSNQLIDEFINYNKLEEKDQTNKRAIRSLKHNMKNFNAINDATDQFFSWVLFYYANYKKENWTAIIKNIQNISSLNFYLNQFNKSPIENKFSITIPYRTINGRIFLSNSSWDYAKKCIACFVNEKSQETYYVNFFYLLPFILPKKITYENDLERNAINFTSIKTESKDDYQLFSDFFWNDFFPIIKRYPDNFLETDLETWKIINEIEENSFLKK